MIQDDRIRRLNDGAAGAGRYVLYWMQASCRAECNHALEYAIRQANELGRPVLACFGLTADFPEANARHYTFLLEGLRDAQAALERRGIPLVVRRGAPDEVAAALAREACLVVTDRGYLRIQREWRDRAAAAIPRALVRGGERRGRAGRGGRRPRAVRRRHAAAAHRPAAAPLPRAAARDPAAGAAAGAAARRHRARRHPGDRARAGRGRERAPRARHRAAGRVPPARGCAPSSSTGCGATTRTATTRASPASRA